MLNKFLKEFLKISLYFFVILLISYFINTYVLQRSEVIGQSMEPTLDAFDNLIVEKITYRTKEPERYDIIVFPYQEDHKTYYIKRIIGLPGETVYIDDDGNIYINGEFLDEEYGKERIENPGIACEEIQLSENEYFVLGDNRNDSMDSRFSSVGNIQKEDIIGKAYLRITPFSKFGILKHA